MPVGVAAVGVVDHRRERPGGAGEAHATARARRQAGDGDPELEALAHDAADGIDVQVEALGRAQARAQLGDHTLDRGERAARGVLGAERAQLGRAAVAELDRRVVVQVRSDAGQVGDDGDAERPQVVRGPDARAQQERGGVVGARAHDHALRLHDGLARALARRRRAPARPAPRAARPGHRRRSAATLAPAPGRDRPARHSSARRRRC